MSVVPVQYGHGGGSLSGETAEQLQAGRADHGSQHFSHQLFSCDDVCLLVVVAMFNRFIFKSNLVPVCCCCS